jgi:hypothetical protein
MDKNINEIRAIALELVEYLDRSAPKLIQISNALRSDSPSGPLVELQNLPDALQTLSEFLQSASMLGHDREASKILTSILNASKIFVQAQETKDFNLLADVLEYDLFESFEAARVLCKRISLGE